jgi:hypothetical protein
MKFLAMLAMSTLLVGCGGSDEPSRQKAAAPTAIVGFQAASPSVLEVLFEVQNPRASMMPSVTCSVSAYVSTRNVAKFLSGGSISNLQPGETRQVRTSIEVTDSQAAFVERVDVSCSSWISSR